MKKRPTGSYLDALIAEQFKKLRDIMVADGMIVIGGCHEFVMEETIEDQTSEIAVLKDGIKLAMDALKTGGGGAESIALAYLEDAISKSS